jgi:hypothetical protein
MNEREIEALSDSELIALSTGLDHGLGPLWLIVPVLAIAAFLAWGLWPAALTCGVTMAACRVVSQLRERSSATMRRRLAEQAFSARYHIGSLARDELQVGELLARPGPLDTVLLFRAWSWPHGGHRFVRIELAEASARLLALATPFLADLHRLPGLHVRMMKLDQPLTAAELTRLRAALAELTPAQRLSDAPPAAGPGLEDLPCELLVLRRGEQPVRASLHFAGTTALAQASPLEGLVALVLDLEATAAGDHVLAAPDALRE